MDLSYGSWPEIEPVPLAVKAQSPNHWSSRGSPHHLSSYIHCSLVYTWQSPAHGMSHLSFLTKNVWLAVL